MLYILSQIIVIISDVFCTVSMLCKNKVKILINLIISTILFSSHYALLGGWTGAITGAIELVFLIILFLLETKNKTKYNLLLSLSTIAVTIVFSIITWAGAISLLPMFSMVIYLIAIMFANVVIVKSGTFIRILLNAIYMILLHSYFGAIFSAVILGSSIYGIIRDQKQKNLENTTSNEEKHLEAETEPPQ